MTPAAARKNKKQRPPSDSPASKEMSAEPVVFKSVKTRKRRRDHRSPEKSTPKYHDVNVVSAATGHRRKKGNRSLFPSDAEIERKAEFRRKICAPREDGVIRPGALRPHPSRGGSRGYSMKYKLTMIQYYDAGQVFPRYLQRSIQLWKKNGFIAKKQTGNKRKTILKGEHLMIFPTPKHRNVQSLFVSIRQMDLCTHR